MNVFVKNKSVRTIVKEMVTKGVASLPMVGMFLKTQSGLVAHTIGEPGDQDTIIEVTDVGRHVVVTVRIPVDR